MEKMVEEMLAADQVEPEGAAAFVPRPGNSSTGEEEVRRVGMFIVAQEELHETDPEKLAFVENLAELRERWRMILQSQIISQYLDLRADQENKPENQEEAGDSAKALLKTNGELWQEALIKVRKRNRSFFQRLRQETLQDHYDRFFNWVARAFDPHTNYIPPASKEQFDINMRGSLEGIGALLREDDGFIKVVRIIPGSASARQGRLKAEDIILQVAQEGEEPVDVTDMRLRDAVRLIRGPKGKAVSLTIKKSGRDHRRRRASCGMSCRSRRPSSRVPFTNRRMGNKPAISTSPVSIAISRGPATEPRAVTPPTTPSRRWWLCPRKRSMGSFSISVTTVVGPG